MTRCAHALIILVSLCLLPVLPAAAPPQQTVDAVVEKHLAALGGRDALGKLTSRRSTGSASVSTPMGDLSGPIEVSLKAPTKARVIIRLDLSAAGAGELTIDQRFDGTSGIAMNSMQGNTDITGNQLENMKNAVFPTPLLNYKTMGGKLELLPNDLVNGKTAVVLLVTPKAGSPVKLYFDAESWMLVRTVARVNTPMGDIEQTSTQSDYRVVDGVKAPFKVVNVNEIQTVTIVFSKVEHNVAIPDAYFAR